MISLRKLFKQEFQGHKGRPGKVGGSLPRSGGARGGADYDDKEQIGGFKREQYLTDVDMVGGHLDFRQLGERGYHGVNPKFGVPSAGDDIDFYDNNGDKKYGKVISISGNKMIIAPSNEEGIFDKKNTVKRTLVDWKTGKPID